MADLADHLSSFDWNGPWVRVSRESTEGTYGRARDASTDWMFSGRVERGRTVLFDVLEELGATHITLLTDAHRASHNRHSYVEADVSFRRFDPDTRRQLRLHARFEEFGCSAPEAPVQTVSGRLVLTEKLVLGITRSVAFLDLSLIHESLPGTPGTVVVIDNEARAALTAAEFSELLTGRFVPNH